MNATLHLHTVETVGSHRYIQVVNVINPLAGNFAHPVDELTDEMISHYLELIARFPTLFNIALACEVSHHDHVK